MHFHGIVCDDIVISWHGIPPPSNTFQLELRLYLYLITSKIVIAGGLVRLFKIVDPAPRPEFKMVPTKSTGLLAS